MAPSTITETELEPPLHTGDRIDNKESIKNATTNKGYTIDTYDKMMRPEPNFLKPLRRLEKHNYGIYDTTPMVCQIAGFGVTAGAHRLWCHRSYKAKLPFQWILLICYSVAGQNTIYEWVRDHRVHHKHSETTADPHDANRGFFYAHVGWLMMKKHPDVVEKSSKMDLSDITNDPLIQFHTKNIMPVETWFVSAVAMGEGWHNYHHTFPWDYKAAELGMSLNLTTTLLNFFAKIGWAYDLKQASPAHVETVMKARGDPKYQHRH